MPKFYFDLIRNGDLTIDHVGCDLADVAQAQDEAVRALVEIAADTHAARRPVSAAVSIVDSTRKPVCRATLVLDPGKPES